MGEQDLKELARLIADELKHHQDCQLTPEEQAAIRSLLSTRKNAVKGLLYIVGAIALWIIKDIYFFAIKHIGWN